MLRDRAGGEHFVGCGAGAREEEQDGVVGKREADYVGDERKGVRLKMEVYHSASF
jgi:hypothetical protein